MLMRIHNVLNVNYERLCGNTMIVDISFQLCCLKRTGF